MVGFNPEDFITLYPGVYTEKERALVKQYIAESKALEERGPIDVQALINGTLPEGTPGIGPRLVVTESMVRYNNQKYDPENPLLHDAEYAQKLGYQSILAMPCFGAHDDSFMSPYPPEARDTLLVSQLNHSATCYKPIYPGDTLYFVFNSRRMADRTPAEGALYRSVAICCEGSVYNQRGEKVNDVVFRVMESIKIYKEGKRPEVMGFAQLWESPDWLSRPAHVYTDEDWDFIRYCWRKEKRQGAEPLYWEDVKVGDEPAWTVDGPILETVIPTEPYGMGTGGSRTLKKELLDPQMAKTLIKEATDGIYRLPNPADYIPAVPDGVTAVLETAASDATNAINTADIHNQSDTIHTADIHKQTDERGVLINFLGRDIAIRHINNWMGDHGWLRNIRWGIIPVEAQADYGKKVPLNPEAEYFLNKIPYMKGKCPRVHGLTQDLAIVKSYLYDKYVCGGECFAELAWWIETIEGDIWLAGGATVKLPSRRIK